jgi:hypothetical protein
VGSCALHTMWVVVVYFQDAPRPVPAGAADAVDAGSTTAVPARNAPIMSADRRVRRRAEAILSSSADRALI